MSDISTLHFCSVYSSKSTRASCVNLIALYVSMLQKSLLHAVHENSPKCHTTRQIEREKEQCSKLKIFWSPRFSRFQFSPIEKFKNILMFFPASFNFRKTPKIFSKSQMSIKCSKNKFLQVWSSKGFIITQFKI